MGGRSGGGAAGGMGSRSRGGGWPALSGSEKQVAWANDIRSGAQKALDFIKPYATNPQAKAVVDGWEKKMQGMTSAKQWIDSRYDAPKATYPVSAGYQACCPHSDVQRINRTPLRRWQCRKDVVATLQETNE